MVNKKYHFLEWYFFMDSYNQTSCFWIFEVEFIHKSSDNEKQPSSPDWVMMLKSFLLGGLT